MNRLEVINYEETLEDKRMKNIRYIRNKRIIRKINNLAINLNDIITYSTIFKNGISLTRYDSTGIVIEDNKTKVSINLNISNINKSYFYKNDKASKIDLSDTDTLYKLYSILDRVSKLVKNNIITDEVLDSIDNTLSGGET